MSNRSFILLLIIIALITGGIMGFLYLRQTITPVANNEQGINFISKFNPFRDEPATTPEEIGEFITPTEPDAPQTSPEAPREVLRKVSNLAVSGYGEFSKERYKEIPVILPPTTATTATTTEPVKKTVAKKPTPPPTEFVPALRYVDRATGNIFETFLDKIEEKKFSEVTIPQIVESYFGGNAEWVIMRYLKRDGVNIETLTGTLPKEVLGADTTANNTIKKTLLPDNIFDLSLSPDGKKVFYLFKIGEGVAGVTYNLVDGKKVQVFDSPFTEWLSSWPNANLITLTTKPSGATPGYMYTLDLVKKSFTKTLGPINGLTTISNPTGALVLYADNNLSLNLYHKDTGITEPLNLQTLPEKCVWASIDEIYCSVPKVIEGKLYPDAWYQGEVSFSDQIWKINVRSGNTTLLVDPLNILGGEETDGIRLSIDKDGKYLFFMNKKNSTLWALDLK